MRSNLVRRLLLSGASLAAVLLTASPSFAQATPGDPWEGLNRRMFAIEQVLERTVVGPATYAYSKTPTPIRTALHNFSRNLGEPVIAINDLLQGRVGTAASTVGRFAINSIFGIAGFMDPATRGRIPYHDNDFGITLGRWGVGPGPYLFVPLIGPSTVRDGVGSGVDVGLNPFTWIKFDGRWALGFTTEVIEAFELRLAAEKDLATLFATSIDPYATLRSFYLQNRQAVIAGPVEGQEPQEVPLPPIPDAAADAASEPTVAASAETASPATPEADSPTPGEPTIASEPVPDLSPPDRRPSDSACQVPA